MLSYRERERARKHAYYLAHREEYIEKARKKYEKVRNDPELREKHNAYQREYYKRTRI